MWKDTYYCHLAVEQLLIWQDQCPSIKHVSEMHFFLFFYTYEVLSLQLVKAYMLFLLLVDVDPIVQTWLSEEHKPLFHSIRNKQSVASV